jgi:hypothetical protein
LSLAFVFSHEVRNFHGRRPVVFASPHSRFFFFAVFSLERTLEFSTSCFLNFGGQNYCIHPLQEVPGEPQGKILNRFVFSLFVI